MAEREETPPREQKQKAWGSLQPDQGNSPGKARRKAIKRYDPTAPTAPRTPTKDALRFGDSPQNWEFYQNERCYVIDEELEIYGRKATSVASRCTWMYIAKKTPKGHLKLRFTLFEAKKFTPFLDVALRQIYNLEAKNLDNMEIPLPLFNGDLDKATFSPRGKNQGPFWDEPHVTTASLKIRLNVSDLNGEFEFYFLNPVSEAVRESNDGWCGYDLVLLPHQVEALLSFVESP